MCRGALGLHDDVMLPPETLRSLAEQHIADLRQQAQPRRVKKWRRSPRVAPLIDLRAIECSSQSPAQV
jgi:hypothetical protein